jgi:transglutaminase-like putative cysteine protease
VRVVLMTAVALVIGIPETEVFQWYVRQEFTRLVGCLLGVELAIRAWSAANPKHPSERLGVALVLTGAILTMASCTYDREPMALITPVYAVLVLLSLRAFSRINTASQMPPSPAKPPPPKRRPLLMGLRVGAMGAALVIGWLAVENITRYERALTSWASDLVRQRRPQRSTMGLSVTPQLRSSFDLEARESRLLYIDGQASERYLRLFAFDTYSETYWLPSYPDRTFTAVNPRQLQVHNPQAEKLHFRPIGDTGNFLLVPIDAAAVFARGDVEQEQTGGLRFMGNVADIRYDVYVTREPAHQGPLAIAPDDEAFERLLHIPPEIDPRVTELAREIAGDQIPFHRVTRLAGYLRANHSYSLRFAPQGEPINDFILNRRAGHCQYFASALVMMSRAAGVPARFVTGFYAHERDGDQRIVVRDRDAHAWVECWIDGVGWVTFDATPAGGRPDQLYQRPAWYKRAWEYLQDIPARLREWYTSLQRSTIILVTSVTGGVWLAYALFNFLRNRKRRKATAAAREYPQPTADLVAAARWFESVLRRRGLELQPSRTWREQLLLAGLTAPTLVGELRDACLRFVDVYEEARFGASDPGAIYDAQRTIEQLMIQPPATGRNDHGPRH